MYKIISFLFAWLILDKDKRRGFKKKCLDIEEAKKASKIRKNYPNIINRIKNKKEKIRVLFFVNEIAKWKTQSLYDLLDKNDRFEPVVAVTLLTKAHNGKDKTRDNLDEMYNYFADKKMNVVKAYKNNKYLDLKIFEPDIIFYQQPWYIPKEQSPEKTGKFALLCYMPYYVMNYGGEMDYNQPLHKYLFRHYMLNDEWANLYTKLSGLDNFVATGHTMIDNYLFPPKDEKKQYVIYAPHYSFPHKNNDNPVNYGTILKNGKEILEFAQKHSEINWVFKPHPQLKFSLLKAGYSYEDVENYYSGWAKAGILCEDNSYSELFLNSKALITDSASFLIEYFCTKKPIIRLISSECKIKPMRPSEKIFDTFYDVHNLDEMYETFEKVIIKGEDEKKEERLSVLKESHLLDNSAAENILADLEKTLF